MVSSSDSGPGNTPLHLAMESAHAEVAVLLINAGARRDEVSSVSMPELLLELTGYKGECRSGDAGAADWCRWPRAAESPAVCRREMWARTILLKVKVDQLGQ